MHELDADVPPYPRLPGPRAACLVIVLRLAKRPRLPMVSFGRVDTSGSSNGVVEKMGAAEWNLKRLGHDLAFNALQLRRRPPSLMRGRRGASLT
jgi:hypothetical protein